MQYCGTRNANLYSRSSSLRPHYPIRDFLSTAGLNKRRRLSGSRSRTHGDWTAIAGPPSSRTSCAIAWRFRRCQSGIRTGRDSRRCNRRDWRPKNLLKRGSVRRQPSKPADISVNWSGSRLYKDVARRGNAGSSLTSCRGDHSLHYRWSWSTINRLLGSHAPSRNIGRKNYNARHLRLNSC